MNSLCNTLTYNREEISEKEGRLLTTDRVYNDGTGTMDIRWVMEDLLALMPVRSKVEKPVVRISLDPHPDSMLTDIKFQDITREYLEKMGFGNQPCMVYKHEDIGRHHLHVVTVRADGDGRSADARNSFYRSKQITHRLERKYGLHGVGWKNRRTDMPLHKVDVLAGDAKKQTGNVVEELNCRYRFQTMGEYRALLFLYNTMMEEAQGNIRGQEYNGLVYSAANGSGSKVGNPSKSSLFGKPIGYDTVQRKFTRSETEIKDRRLADVTKRTVPSVLQGAYNEEGFITTFREKGIDTVLRYTEEGHIYGTALIDRRAGCMLNDSRMGGELSAGTLQEHFMLPHTGQPPVPLFITTEGQGETQAPSTPEYGKDLSYVGLFSPESPTMDVEGEAFIRAMQHRKKRKEHEGLGT